MLWPIFESGARLIKVWTDEAAGELFITAVFDEKFERDIIYEAMFCTQLSEESAGLVVTSVFEVTPEELKQTEHVQTAALLFEGIRDGERFIQEMHSQGSHLFVHRTGDGGEYIVLAERLFFGRMRPYTGEVI